MKIANTMFIKHQKAQTTIPRARGREKHVQRRRQFENPAEDAWVPFPSSPVRDYDQVALFAEGVDEKQAWPYDPAEGILQEKSKVIKH